MRRAIMATVGVVALVTATAGTMQAWASTRATPPNVAGRAHLLLTRSLLEAKRLGMSPGCLGTLSPGCLPIPMQYNGGPVEAAGSRNYLIFWQPRGSTVAPGYNATLRRFFADVGGSSVYGVASQYYQKVNGTTQHIANSASVGGTWTDTAAYPSGTLQDKTVQTEVAKAVHANGWPTGVGNEYFVFLAKGEKECMGSTCSFTTYCAYHSSFGSGSSTVLYAAMPYAGTNLQGCGIQTGAGTPNGADTDAEISITSHELIETVTDPMLNAWYDLFGSEIGDKCAYTYAPTQPNGADLTIHGHPYIVQEEFSNADLGCAI